MQSGEGGTLEEQHWEALEQEPSEDSAPFSENTSSLDVGRPESHAGCLALKAVLGQERLINQ